MSLPMSDSMKIHLRGNRQVFHYPIGLSNHKRQKGNGLESAISA